MRLLQTSLNVPYFEKYCPLNKKEPAEDLDFSKFTPKVYSINLQNSMFKVEAAKACRRT